MTTRKVRIEDFGGVLRKRIQADAEQARQAAYDTCLRVEEAAVDETRRQGLYDLGEYEFGWSHGPIGGGFRVGNDAPYAGVIEHGRRPGRPGPPIKPIREWVQRKLVGNGVVDAKDADRVAFAIRRSIHVNGTRPRHVFRTAAAHLRAWFGEELRRRLRR